MTAEEKVPENAEGENAEVKEEDNNDNDTDTDIVDEGCDNNNNNNDNNRDNDDNDHEIASLPLMSEDNDSDSEGCSNLLPEVQDDETWQEITKRDRTLSNANLNHVIDHSYESLKDRICEAGNSNSNSNTSTSNENNNNNEQQHNFCELLTVFEKKLGRFKNSEIIIGDRIASGNFADIYEIRCFRQQEHMPSSSRIKACTKDQAEEAEKIKKNYNADELVIKVLRKSLLYKPSLFATAAADLITEGTLLASMDCPHIVSIRGRSDQGVVGFGTGKRDSVFLMLERLDGDLTYKMVEWKEKTSVSQNGFGVLGRRRDNKITVLRERLVAMADLASAMAYIHERNIIHRDLKIGNVGISVEGKVKLIDFGLAKVLPSANNANETFLLTGNTGSVRYMAPEIGLGQRYNLKADVYSFAILLYEVMSLEKVFQGWNLSEISNRVYLKKYRPRLFLFWSQQLKEVLKACWSDVSAARLPMKNVETILHKEVNNLTKINNTDIDE